MGSFLGHVLPGSFFILFSVWWMVRMFQRHMSAIRGAPFRSTVTYSCQLCLTTRKLNVEAIIVTIACGIGMFVEIIVACIFRGRPIGIANIQHATMYFCFGVPAVIALLEKCLARPSTSLEQVKFMGLAVAYIVEGLLFKFHLYGRDNVDVLVHTLLVYTIFANAAATLLEMKYRTSVLCALSRAFFTCLQGTWFWQVAFILYNPFTSTSGWDPENHKHLMLVTCMFTWHMTAMFVLFLVSGAAISCYYRRQGNVLLDTIIMEAGQEKVNGYKRLSTDGDDRDDSTTEL